MAGYLNIYIKPKNSDNRILVYSYTRSTDMYRFFYENNLSVYCGMDNKTRELSGAEINYAINELGNEISRDEKRLSLMKEQHDDIYEILNISEYIDEQKELKNHAYMIMSLLPNDYNDIEAVYSNYS